MNWLQKQSMGLWEDIEEETKGIDEMMNYERRHDFAKQFGWAIPSKEAIEKIKSFVGNERILEIGAGRGTWAKLMQDAGIQITPTDIHAGRPVEEESGESIVHPENQYWKPSHMEEIGVTDRSTYTDVYRLESDLAVEQFGDHSVLMMVWPSYDQSWAVDALKKFAGNKLIYVGEDSGGCTGDECLHETLYNEWSPVEKICIPQWQGIYDCLYLYTRK